MTDNKAPKEKKRLVSKAYTNGGFENEVLNHYLKGIYIENGKKVQLPEKINKYNNKFLSDISAINSSFYNIIRTERVMIKLLEARDKNSHFGDIRNLYNLIYAQNATIKVNKSTRTALKTYGITKQKLYDNLKSEIDKQYERIKRNTLILNDMANDYGLDGVVDIIKEETGMSLVEHVAYFSDNLSKVVAKSTDKDDMQDFYEKQTQEYIDYLVSLANKHNIDIYTYESESLKTHREARALLKEKVLEEKKADKEQKRNEHMSAIIDKDNDYLQHDINADSEEYSHKNLPDRVRYNLFTHIKNNYNGVAFYIAAIKQTKVQYIDTNNTLTYNAAKIKWFHTHEDATSCLDEHKDTEEFKKMYAKICKIELTECLSRQADNRLQQINNTKLSPKYRSDKAIDMLTLLLNSYNFDTRLREDVYAHMRIMHDAIECNNAIPLPNVPYYITVVTATFIGGSKHGTVRFLSNITENGKKSIGLTDYNLGAAIFPNDINLQTDKLAITSSEYDKLEFRQYKIELQPRWLGEAFKILNDRRVELSLLIMSDTFRANESRYAESSLKKFMRSIINSNCLNTGEAYCIFALQHGAVYWTNYFAINAQGRYKNKLIAESPLYAEVFSTYQEAYSKIADLHKALNEPTYNNILYIAKLDVNPMQLRNNHPELILGKNYSKAVH